MMERYYLLGTPTQVAIKKKHLNIIRFLTSFVFLFDKPTLYDIRIRLHIKVCLLMRPDCIRKFQFVSKKKI